MEMCLWSASLGTTIWVVKEQLTTKLPEKNGTVYPVQVTYPKGRVCEEQ